MRQLFLPPRAHLSQILPLAICVSISSGAYFVPSLITVLFLSSSEVQSPDLRHKLLEKVRVMADPTWINVLVLGMLA